MSIGLCSIADVITFDQHLHYFYSSSVREKDIFSDHVVIPRLQWAWNMHKNANKFEWKLGASWVHLATLWQGLPISMMLRNIPWTGSKPSRRSNTGAKRYEKEKKERQKAQKGGSLSHPKTPNFNFYACPSENVIKLNSSMLSCCKCLYWG